MCDLLQQRFLLWFCALFFLLWFLLCGFYCGYVCGCTGQVLGTGLYQVVQNGYDGSSNRAQCDFKVAVRGEIIFHELAVLEWKDSGSVVTAV